MKLNNAEMLKLADGAISLCGLAVIAVQTKDPREERWDQIELKVSAVEYLGKEGTLGVVGQVVDFFNPIADAILGARFEPYTPTIAREVPVNSQTLGQLLGYERFSKRSKAHLHQTKHPNALPTSWRCPG